MYYVNFVFLGVYCDTSKDLYFNRIQVKFEYFDEWLDLSGFSIDRTENRRELKINFKLPDDITINLDEKSSISIINSYEVDQKKGVGVKQYSYVRFDHKQKVHFKEALRELLHFQNLLTLFIQYSATPKSLEFFFKEGRKKTLHKTEVYYSLLKPQKTTNQIHWVNMLIPYKLIKNNFSNIVVKWMQWNDTYRNILNPFFSTYNSPFYYVADKFLNITKSIEAYHRDKTNLGGTYFRERIEQVLKEYSNIYNGILRIRSKRKFAEKIKNLRNKFTHSNAIVNKVDNLSMQLIILSEQLQLIMTCVLLSEIGLDQKKIKNQVERTNIFSNLKND